VNEKPGRFEGFAALPMSQPTEAPVELERAVKKLGMKGAMVCGRTGEKNLDHRDFWPLFEAADALRAPLFIHPQIPQKAIRDIYYSGFDPMVNLAFSTFGLGWHYEAGIQFLRLLLSGVFDQFPNLQIILGHWGEVILFYTERLKALDRMSTLKRTLLDYMRQNLYITASGMFNASYMQQSIEIVGTDRIIFSTDYPYQYRPGSTARKFIEQVPLSENDKEKFAHGNWERLVGEIKID
jgi:predicted TIM-barrel fold metal-dependent hydrolase